MRRFIGAAKTEQIIFVRGTTEAINLVAKAWGAKHLKPGDEIVITNLEHHANIVPWQMITKQTGAVLKVAPVDDAGNLLGVAAGVTVLALAVAIPIGIVILIALALNRAWVRRSRRRILADEE